jgi:hypothetical protein
MTMKTIIAVLLVFMALGWFAALARIEHANSRTCVPIFPIPQSKALIASLDEQSPDFASTTVDLMGRSAEGGTQATFKDATGRTRVVEQRFYGETGRSHMRFYYNRGKLFSIVKLNLTYAVPITVDPSGPVKSSEQREYYLNDASVVCMVTVNNAEQPADNETQGMIAQYIKGIL